MYRRCIVRLIETGKTGYNRDRSGGTASVLDDAKEEPRFLARREPRWQQRERDIRLGFVDTWVASRSSIASSKMIVDLGVRNTFGQRLFSARRTKPFLLKTSFGSRPSRSWSSVSFLIAIGTLHQHHYGPEHKIPDRPASNDAGRIGPPASSTSCPRASSPTKRMLQDIWMAETRKALLETWKAALWVVFPCRPPGVSISLSRPLKKYLASGIVM
jgi:hypothetical protein